MVSIKPSNKDIEVFVTNMGQGDKPGKLAICLKKVLEGNLKVIHILFDEDVENFLKEIK